MSEETKKEYPKKDSIFCKEVKTTSPEGKERQFFVGELLLQPRTVAEVKTIFAKVILGKDGKKYIVLDFVEPSEKSKTIVGV